MDYLSSTVYHNQSLTNISNWVHCENHLNGAQSHSSDPLAVSTDFPPEYRPGAASYTISLYSVAKNACAVFQSNFPNKQLLDTYIKSDTINYLVHPINISNPTVPHIEKIISQPFQNITVTPTTSTRTVFVLDGSIPPHCIKPHTDLYITKRRRHMELRKVKHAVGITRILEKATVFHQNPKQSFFPESFGVVYDGRDDKDWGFILREMTSKPELKQPYHMIPLCSLYVSNASTQEPPLIVNMIKKSDKDADVYLLENLIYPLIDGWIQIYLDTGVLLEPHGQNVVVEIDDANDRILRFAHRDFECVVNREIASNKGHSLTDLNESDLFDNNENDFTPQGAHVSLCFDNSMAVPLEALADIAQDYFEIPKEFLRKACKEYLASTHSTFLQEHFPKNGLSYCCKKVDNEKFFVEKKEPPLWR